MNKKTNANSRVLRELLETAADLSAYGLVSKADMAQMNALCSVPPEYSPQRVVAIRTGVARMSQQVFASVLNVSVSTVQKWESPSAEKHPSGAAAKLLQIVETKGIEAVMA
ncbi:MAG: transcriptional regulator [Pseudomonadota bacterium]